MYAEYLAQYPAGIRYYPNAGEKTPLMGTTNSLYNSHYDINLTRGSQPN